MLRDFPSGLTLAAVTGTLYALKMYPGPLQPYSVPSMALAERLCYTRCRFRFA